MIFMGACRGSGIFNCCTSLESLSKIIFNNFIESTLFSFIFYCFGTEIIWLASGFLRRKIVDEHKEIKEDVKNKIGHKMCK